MRKMIKVLMIQGITIYGIAIFVYIASDSLLIAVIVFSILMFLAMTKPVLLVLNRLTQRTNWYMQKTEDATKFRKKIPLDLDICNLGSNSGKYAFNYENTGLKGENWALGPQTLSYDYRVLKNYFSYLKEGATVLMPLCPFSSCIKDFEDDKINYKYYSFLHPILILKYSPLTSEKVLRFVNKPFQVSPLKSVLRILSDIPADNNKTMEVESLEADANEFIYNWKQQFSILDLDAQVTKENKECITYNTVLLKEMISFCLERNLKPVVLIPPTTTALSTKLSETFRENYIYSFIKEANSKQVLFLNYLDDDRFVDSNLYFNSYFLNQNGQKKFTSQVLSDLGLLE